MAIDRELILSMLSLLGAWSAASMLTWYISAYKTIEETRDKRKSGKAIGFIGRLKLLLAVVGGFSLFRLYYEDPELFGPVVSGAVVIFVVWLVAKRKSPF